MRKPYLSALALAILSFAVLSCGRITVLPTTGPIFTDPAVKLTELSNPSFVNQLINEALALDPVLDDTNTRVHMGYWSLGANRTRLVRVLDAINAYTSTEVFRGIWDEGTTTAAATQYPSYVTMNKEYWYERAYPLSDGTVSIEGVHYVDPHPVTPRNADDIWGTYSKRYADMAAVLRQRTGITPEARCFVQGARAVRVFYTYELPSLVSLEATGDVYVYFAVTSEADWRNPADWVLGTGNAPTPAP